MSPLSLAFARPLVGRVHLFWCQPLLLTSLLVSTVGFTVFWAGFDISGPAVPFGLRLIKQNEWT